MNETILMWFEIIFNISYLVVIWLITFLMFKKLKSPALKSGIVTAPIAWGFLLLAAGDTGHVGFRVVAYAMGDLQSSITLFGTTITLTGIGSLATAYTVTFLYMLLAYVWKKDTNPNRSGKAVYGFVQGAAIFRLIIMMFPQNQWGATASSATWSILRNIPITVSGLMIGLMFLISAIRKKGTHPDLFRRMAVYIFLSYIFYLPVILFVRKIPVLGMLMIPKTVMYILMAGDSYRTLFIKK